MWLKMHEKCFSESVTVWRKWVWIFRHVGKIAKATVGFTISYLSLGMKAPNGWIFMTFDIRVVFKNQLRKSKFDKNLTRITGTLHEDHCTLLIISCWIIVRMKNVWGKWFRENCNTHFMFSNFFFKILAIYVVVWKNILSSYREWKNAWWKMEWTAYEYYVNSIICWVHFSYVLYFWERECDLISASYGYNSKPDLWNRTHH